ncbi:MAG: response regulator transcription factor [Acidobacteriota bacterium]|jgi:DNA-binding NarL/FixJ family response regulator|nr:response regulator transcription factor [Acidobacteriota bacterium]
MTTIIIADDHQLLRESISSLLREVPNFNIVSQCENGRQLLKEVEQLRPNVVVTDITMSELNGIDATRQIRKISPGTRVVALSVHAEETYIRDMIDAGISGYVVKSGAAADLVAAIRSGSRGKVYFSREISDTAQKIQNKDGGYRHKTACSPEKTLTGREREILQLIGEGCSSVQIANKLYISESTVKTHRNNLMDKLDVRDVAGLTRNAIRLKLVYVE